MCITVSGRKRRAMRRVMWRSGWNAAGQRQKPDKAWGGCRRRPPPPAPPPPSTDSSAAASGRSYCLPFLPNKPQTPPGVDP